MSKSFYITTAIDYANGSPHLGHAYEKVLTDVIARYRRLMGDHVHFLTGLDEHGQKVQQTAQKEGIDAQAFCDRLAKEFKQLCEDLSISNDDYIRTTESRHKKVVQQLVQQLYDQGEIYRAEYTGYYSPRIEQFLNERDKVNGEWPESLGEVQEITETNYFFRLSAYQDWLIDFLKQQDCFIYPRFRTQQVLEFLKEPLNDLCISRPRERLSWGVPLPFDEDYVTYVWFDALTNYISVIGYGEERFGDYWPADYHVIGKDILVPPHSVYWPIMLKACGIEPPKALLVHGWWQVKGQKMSKSTGNSISPLDFVQSFGSDAFRYFLMREMNVGQDSDFSPELFLSRYNNDLGNDLGNLLSRLLNMGQRYCNGRVPESSLEEKPEKDLKEYWESTRESVLLGFEEMQFHTGLEKTFQFIRQINRYAEIRAPWKCAKSDDPKDQEAMKTAIASIAEGLRLASSLLLPIMPETTKRIHELMQLNVPTTWDAETHSWGKPAEGNQLGERTILFPRHSEPTD